MTGYDFNIIVDNVQEEIGLKLNSSHGNVIYVSYKFKFGGYSFSWIEIHTYVTFENAVKIDNILKLRSETYYMEDVPFNGYEILDEFRNLLIDLRQEIHTNDGV